VDIRFHLFPLLLPPASSIVPAAHLEIPEVLEGIAEGLNTIGACAQRAEVGVVLQAVQASQAVLVEPECLEVYEGFEAFDACDRVLAAAGAEGGDRREGRWGQWT